MSAVSAVSAVQAWLEGTLTERGAKAGTVHLFDPADGLLHLAAWVAIPPPVLDAVRTIPRGKGMAGLAWERDVPVQTCNLQTDRTGDVRPGARAVDAQAAVALPVHGPDGTLRAVVGFAFAGERELTPDEIAALAALAETLP